MTEGKIVRAESTDLTPALLDIRVGRIEEIDKVI